MNRLWFKRFISSFIVVVMLMSIGGIASADGAPNTNASIVINEANFPDAEFRRYLELNTDQNNNGVIEYDEVGTDFGISIAGEDIESLAGLSNIIKTFEVSKISIYLGEYLRVDLSGCSSLKSVEIEGYPTSVNFSGCTNVTRLTIYSDWPLTISLDDMLFVKWLYDNNVNYLHTTWDYNYYGEYEVSYDSRGNIDEISYGSSTELLILNSNTIVVSDTAPGTVNMYRLYNSNSGEHFYTSNINEGNLLVSLGWIFEGIGWNAPASSNTPVYRLYNQNGGEHHYTTSVAERDMLVGLGWNDEGIGWYSDDNCTVPLYRQYNPNAFANNHNYTTSLSENDWLVSLGWQAEGIGWYGIG